MQQQCVCNAMSVAMRRYCEKGTKVALCVSGGVDSISLLHSCRPDLCRRSCPEFKNKLARPNLQPIVITIDHGLRLESAAEADMVCDRSKTLGMQAIKIPLAWDEEVVPSNQIMEAARMKRYEAIADACSKEGCAYILTAHHQGDQLETLLMRMQFGSGLSGLAGMRPLTSMSHLLNSHSPESQALTVLRPFLELTRDDLQAFCCENELDWVEDPSNSDMKYMRTRMRQLLNDPSSAILKDRVIRLLGRCTEWRERNDRQAVELAQAATEPADVIVYWILKRLEGPSGLPVTVPCKRVELDTSALQASCSRVRFAVVAAALQAVHSRNFAPHSKDVERTLQYAFNHETVKRTYHKCYVHCSRSGALLLEPQNA